MWPLGSNDWREPLTDSSSSSSACSKGLAGSLFLLNIFSVHPSSIVVNTWVSLAIKKKKKTKRLERGKKLKDLIYCFKYLSNLFTSRTIEHIGIWIKDTAEILRQFWCCLGLSKKVLRMVRLEDTGHKLSTTVRLFPPSPHFILLLEHCSFHVGKAGRPGPLFH